MRSVQVSAATTKATVYQLAIEPGAFGGLRINKQIMGRVVRQIGAVMVLAVVQQQRAVFCAGISHCLAVSVQYCPELMRS